MHINNDTIKIYMKNVVNTLRWRNSDGKQKR
jgi:hypothetical protein